MKTIILALVLLVACPLAPTGCKTAPAERVVQVQSLQSLQSLKSVGQAAEQAVVVSARLYQDGQLTAAQAREVLDFFNQKFQPAFRLAVLAVQSDLSPASPEVLSLGGQLSALLLSYRK